jgi:uncharacterized membrane protein YhaH (DUF805 family)
VKWYFAALRNYAGFRGRARRAEYWWFALVNTIALIALVALGAAVKTTVPYLLYELAVVIPSLAVAVRRLHDTGRSGWWLLIALVPIAGAIALIVFLCLDGEAGSNKHGANPKTIAPVARTGASHALG